MENIAINAVMAGCLPPHMPLVIAAVQAAGDPEFGLYSVQATTHPCAVLPRTPMDDGVAFVRLLADEVVLTVHGPGFGMPGHIRISLTGERDTVVRARPGFERAFRRARRERG